MKRQCRCSPPQIEQYRQRISGPLLDRIDIHCEVPLVDFRELSHHSATGEKSETIRERVVAARHIQNERFRKSSNSTNASMSPRQMKLHCQISAEAFGYLEHAIEEMRFSARAHDRFLLLIGRIYQVEAHLREEGAGPLDRQRARWLESGKPYDHLVKLMRRVARFRGITPDDVERWEIGSGNPATPCQILDECHRKPVRTRDPPCGRAIAGRPGFKSPIRDRKWSDFKRISNFLTVHGGSTCETREKSLTQNTP